MGKKGIVASAVRAAVTAAEKAIAPSPLAKRVIAAAAAEAVRQVEQRAPEILAPVEKALRRNAGDLAKPIDKALAPEPQESGRSRRKQSKRKSSARAKAGGRKTAASRKKKNSSRARASAARKKTTTSAKRGKKKAGRSKRR